MCIRYSCVFTGNIRAGRFIGLPKASNWNKQRLNSSVFVLFLKNSFVHVPLSALYCRCQYVEKGNDRSWIENKIVVGKERKRKREAVESDLWPRGQERGARPLASFDPIVIQGRIPKIPTASGFTGSTRR